MSYPGIGLHYEHGKEDWTINALECSKKEKILITMTNMDENESITLHAKELLWEVRREEEIHHLHREKSEREIVIAPHNSFTWEWSPAKVGIFRIFPTVYSDKEKTRVLWGYEPEHPELAVPLRRKVIVSS